MRRPGILLPLALIALLVVGVGAFILVDLRRTAREAQNLYVGLARGLDLIGGLEYETQEARRAMLYALTTKDANLQVTYADESRAADARVARLIDDQTRLLDSPDAADAARRLGRDWATYLKTRDEVLASILEGSVGDAVARDLRDGVPALNRVRDDLLEIQQLYKDRAELRMSDVSTSSNRSFLRLIVLLAATQTLAVFAIVVLQKNQMLQAVQQSEERLREVIESINEGMFVVGRDGRGNLWNRAAERMWGRPRDQVIGQPLAAVFPEVGATAPPRAIGDRRLTVRPIPPVVEFARRELQVIVKALAIRKGIALTFDLPPDLPDVTADLPKFKQVMYNLLSNAIKFTRPGGAVTTTASITHEDSATDPFLRVSVTDTGIGIKPADQARIFGEFEQVDSSYGREQQGTGLGLALTRQLVALHGGRIWLDSDEGKGSTFTFVIPVKTDARRERLVTTPDAAPGVEQAAARPIVLVAEDDPNASELLTQYISGAGYVVRHAFDGEQAVSMAREIRPLAITLDILMPKKDGWKVLSELKSHPETRAIPVVIVSITDDRQLGFNLGATDFLLKPVNKEGLIEVLERAVGSSARRIHSVLVVDDEPHIVDFVGNFLHGHAIEVLKAYGGARGVAMAIEHRPDAIILDLMMPGVTGFDVVRRLREDPRAHDIRILMRAG